MKTRHARLVYVGSMGSGRATSLGEVLRLCGRRALPEDISNETGQHFKMIHGDHEWDLLATVSWARAALGDGQVKTPELERRIARELDLLPKVDGFVFVVDSRPDRFDAARAQYEMLLSDLSARGKPGLESQPIVFQANWRDDAGATAMEKIRATFAAPRSAFVESVATKSMGTVDAIRELLSLIAASSAPSK